ncbi:hypothetical protein DFR55_11059 [Herbinix hemicellulosilytica]|uniref:Uncharacterized protein n=1 Tax=Herbinix hemicellulosilytica TaxID=1564487 RepID=A0A0H5SJC3_HERHM|nr:hypothetical protein [Herbinix hemicellulosilytica]RBP58683.1 hypothetical protein DFR55_11059 [Herbinix hemicellulosilytica]CRZ35607.1 hypothetical protein HHT355_2421 [Herbinix hemicellulosilytica]
MKTTLIVFLIVALVITGILVALYFVGRKLQKRQEEAEEQMKAAAQTFSILVIDKKKMKLTEANLPKMVVDQTPKYLRRSKVPIVKAKIGPKIMSLMCDPKVFDLIPVKKEVKAVISGIYITDVKGLRSGLEKKPQKKGLFKKIKDKFSKEK